MKQTLKLLADSVVALAIAQPAIAMDKVKIATEGAYKPWNYKDSAGKLVGFELDLARALCERMKAECEIVEQAWDGMIPALTAGKYDAIMAGMSITPKRQKVISFSRAYASVPTTFTAMKSQAVSKTTTSASHVNFSKGDKGKATVATLSKAFAGKTVGVQTSTTHEQLMKGMMPGVGLKSYDTMENMMLDLQAGRIDAGLTNMGFLKPVMEKDKNVVAFGPTMTGGPLGPGVGVGTRKKDSALREKFSAAIDGMISDGSLSKLATKWFGFDAAAK